MAAEFGNVRLRVDKKLDGASIQFGAPVQFQPMIERSQKSGGTVRQPDRSRRSVNAVASVSARTDQYSSVRLIAGDYDVEAVLPSGELLNAEVRVVAFQSVDLVLRGERSPNEWRSWSHFAGAALASPRQTALERIAYKTVVAAPAEDLVVTLGNRVCADGVDGSFDPSSWMSWFDYAERRYRLRDLERFEPSLELTDDQSGLRVERKGGYDGSPVRISIFQDQFEAVEATSVGKRRAYISIASAAGSRLFALPFPWHIHGWRQQDRIFEILALEERGRLRCDPALLDEQWGGLLAYMNTGRVQLAASILNQAREALLEKFENPLAASVGGYILLSTDAGDGGWTDWIANLAQRFPHLPDGAILRARWLLNRPGKNNVKEAHDLLVEGVARGLPFFTIGVVWLIESMQRTAADCHVCQEMLARIRGVARMIDLGQAFTSFSIARPDGALGALSSSEFSMPSGVDLLEPGFAQLEQEHGHVTKAVEKNQRNRQLLAKRRRMKPLLAQQLVGKS